MSVSEERTVSLTAENAAYIDAKIASGDYATASEIVREGLRALQARDAALERWLRKEVAATYDEMQADPEAALSGEQWIEGVRMRHAAESRRRSEAAARPLFSAL